MISLETRPYSHLWIGPVVARQWYLDGLRTLDDVKNRKNGIKLSPHQEVCGYPFLALAWCLLAGPLSLKLGLKYYDGRSSQTYKCNSETQSSTGRSKFTDPTRRSERHLRTDQGDW